MDPEKTGAFIAELRKEHCLTQKELAEKIGVSDKAVSKWETGRGFPDVSILQALSRELGISVTELINGEKILPEKICEQSDGAVIRALSYVRSMSGKIWGSLAIVSGASLALSPFIVAGAQGLTFVCLIGIALILGGVFVIASKRLAGSPKLPGIISTASLAAAIVLEALPYGGVLVFATDPENKVRRTFSYFDLTLYGYANFAPFITAVMTVLLTVFSVVALFAGAKAGKLKNAIFIFNVITLIISVCPVIYGIEYVTAVGVGISVLLMIAALFRVIANVRHAE